MKCQHCGAKIEYNALFCNECGQAVQSSRDDTESINRFWNNENTKKKDSVVKEISELQQRAEMLHGEIANAERIDAKRRFFRFMQAVFFGIILVACLVGFQAQSTEEEILIRILIALSFTLIPYFIILVCSTIVARDGAKTLLYFFIPLVNYLVFFYGFGCGFWKMFVPLDKNEKSIVSGLKDKKAEYILIKNEEKCLNDGLLLINSYKEGIKNQKALIEEGKAIKSNNPDKKIRSGWKIMQIFTTVVLIGALVLFFSVSKSFV